MASNQTPPGSAFVKFFQEHPAIVGTLLYFQVSAVGIVYSWSLYRKFGINVFDFAEANDFLLAGFKEPFAFGMAMLTLLLAGFMFLLYRRRAARSSGLRSANLFMSKTMPVVAVVYTLAPAWYWGEMNANRILADDARSVSVILSQRGSTDTGPLTLYLIGTTENFAFFFDKQTEEPMVVPVANIFTIEFPLLPGGAE